MSTTTKITVALLMLTTSSTATLAQDGTAGPLGRLVDRTRSGLGGIRRALHRGETTTAAAAPTVPMATPQSMPASSLTPTAAPDPYGFAAILNRIRSAAGLPPVSYDPSLSAWAHRNNAEQSRRGIGHYVNPNCYQNCAWNVPDAGGAAQSWMESPGHRQNMLARDITHFGIAFGPGPYWTLNTR